MGNCIIKRTSIKKLTWTRTLLRTTGQTNTPDVTVTYTPESGKYYIVACSACGEWTSNNRYWTYFTPPSDATVIIQDTSTNQCSQSASVGLLVFKANSNKTGTFRIVGGVNATSSPAVIYSAK